MTFEENKRRKMNENPVLRLSYYVGMIKFREGQYSNADIIFRRLHPLSWVWVIFGSIIVTLMGGIPAAIEAVKELHENSEWW